MTKPDTLVCLRAAGAEARVAQLKGFPVGMHEEGLGQWGGFERDLIQAGTRQTFWIQHGCRTLATECVGTPAGLPQSQCLAVLSCLSLTGFVCPSLNPLFLFLGAYVHVLPLRGRGPISRLVYHNLSGSTPTAISPTTPKLKGNLGPKLGETLLSLVGSKTSKCGSIGQV